MKLKLALTLLLLMPAAFYAHDNRAFLTARQTATPYLNLRLISSLDMNLGNSNIDLNGMNVAIRQDYSDPSGYLVSLNPAMWAAEYGLVCLFRNSSLTNWDIFPKIIIAADMLSNLQLDIYWLRLGIDADYFIYNKKFLCVVELNAGLKYEISKFVVSATYGYALQHKMFMAPWEKEDGTVTLGFSYNLGSLESISNYIFSRGLE